MVFPVVGMGLQKFDTLFPVIRCGCVSDSIQECFDRPSISLRIGGDKFANLMETVLINITS